MYVGTVVLLVLVRTRKKKKVRDNSYLIKKKKNPKLEKAFINVYVLYFDIAAVFAI